LHFEKSRGLLGSALDPIEARLGVDMAGRPQWSWGRAEAGELDHVATLLRDGLDANQIARKLGISKSKAYRLKGQAATNLPAAAMPVGKQS
jgi:hypothetical protein